MADQQLSRTEQITTNMASLLACCASLLRCLDEHASREESPLRTYLPHLRQLASELTELVQVYVDDVPEHGQP